MRRFLGFMLLLAAMASAAPGDALRQPEVQKAALRLARTVMAEALRQAAPPPLTTPLPPLRVGTFVTLEVDGHVRGCRGTLQPMEATLAREIQRNALAASLHDPNYPPLTPAE